MDASIYVRSTEPPCAKLKNSSEFIKVHMKSTINGDFGVTKFLSTVKASIESQNISTQTVAFRAQEAYHIYKAQKTHYTQTISRSIDTRWTTVSFGVRTIKIITHTNY